MCYLFIQRNYRTFLMFIYATSVYIAWTFGVSMASLFVKHAELEAAAASRPQQQNGQDSLSNNLWLVTLGRSHHGAHGFCAQGEVVVVVGHASM